jgi:hypothetical protein
LSGLLNKESALTLISFSRREDNFFAMDVLAVSARDHWQSRRDGSNRVPSLFTPNDAVLNQNYMRIVEDASCSFEIQAVVLCPCGFVSTPHPIQKRIVIQNV